MMKIEKILGSSMCALLVASGLSFPSSANAEAGAGGGGGAAEVPAVASRYVTRLQELVRKADEAALRGAQLMADGDYEGAITEFKAALDLLPDAPMTKDRRDAYTSQFANASVKLARQRAEEARYAEATELLQAVLAPDIDPDNVEAKLLLEQLQDPEYFSPALTPEHLEKVRRVELALKVGRGAFLIGDYDNAAEQYYQVLNDDKYNEAARRSLEEVERRKMQYYGVARDHTRAKFLADIAKGWELPVPISVQPVMSVGPTEIDDDTSLVRSNEAKLQRIILPSVEFVDTPLRDALDFLQARSVELDVEEPDVTKKGVNFVIRGVGGGGGGGGAAPIGGGDGFDGGGAAAPAFGGDDEARITLNLSNVPLVEALRYTTELAQLKFKVEPQAVVIVPLSTPTEDFFSKSFLVPPGFLSSGGGGAGGGGGAAPADPFAAPEPAGGGGVLERPTARGVLESAGILFPEGASAIYNAGSSTLIVKNRLDQLDLVEIYIDSIIDSGAKQIYITSRFVEITEEAGKELGFDWLLGPFNLPSSTRYFGSGGTTGNQSDGLSTGDFAFTEPGAALPVGSNPLSAGLRSGAQALEDDTIDGLIRAAAGDVQDRSVLAPAIFGIAGVFSDPQFQVVIRALNQKKGLDVLSAPSVMARSGQRAKMEVIREFIYPTEYDPPEIPNEVGIVSDFNPVTGETDSSFPVTPATPTAFETRNTGVTLEVDPVIGSDGFTIDLNLAPEVVEFDGFINYGSPITSGTNVLTENRIEMPIFNTRKVTTQVTIWDQQTVALGGLIREDVQDIEDKIPFLGDLPAIGRLFRSNVELHLKRNLTIFVTAELVDPSGRAIH